MTNELSAEQQKSVCIEAVKLVLGDRNADYGHPFHDFERIGKLWAPILGVDVTPEQVALCMVQVKVSREINRPKRDNRVDGCGYFECLDMIHQFKTDECGKR